MSPLKKTYVLKLYVAGILPTPRALKTSGHLEQDFKVPAEIETFQKTAAAKRTKSWHPPVEILARCDNDCDFRLAKSLKDRFAL